MTPTLKALINEIATFAQQTVTAIHSEKDEKFFDEWYPYVSESAVAAAFAFYKEHTISQMVYPPYYVKGKNGAYFEDICIIPEQSGETDYAYYRGVYLNLSFTDARCITVYLDGNDMKYIYDTSDFNAFVYNDAENTTEFEAWVAELVFPLKEVLLKYLEG